MEDNVLAQLIQAQTRQISADISTAYDAYLLGFFGSLENAQKQAHLYVIEETPEYKFDESTMKFSVEVVFKLRRKTAQELDEDDIYRKNSTPYSENSPQSPPLP